MDGHQKSSSPLHLSNASCEFSTSQVSLSHGTISKNRNIRNKLIEKSLRESDPMDKNEATSSQSVNELTSTRQQETESDGIISYGQGLFNSTRFSLPENPINRLEKASSKSNEIKVTSLDLRKCGQQLSAAGREDQANDPSELVCTHSSKELIETASRNNLVPRTFVRRQPSITIPKGTVWQGTSLWKRREMNASDPVLDEKASAPDLQIRVNLKKPGDDNSMVKALAPISVSDAEDAPTRNAYYQEELRQFNNEALDETSTSRQNKMADARYEPRKLEQNPTKTLVNEKKVYWDNFLSKEIHPENYADNVEIRAPCVFGKHQYEEVDDSRWYEEPSLPKVRRNISISIKSGTVRHLINVYRSTGNGTSSDNLKSSNRGIQLRDKKKHEKSSGKIGKPAKRQLSVAIKSGIVRETSKQYEKGSNATRRNAALPVANHSPELAESLYSIKEVYAVVDPMIAYHCTQNRRVNLSNSDENDGITRGTVSKNCREFESAFNLADEAMKYNPRSTKTNAYYSDTTEDDLAFLSFKDRLGKYEDQNLKKSWTNENRLHHPKTKSSVYVIHDTIDGQVILQNPSEFQTSSDSYLGQASQINSSSADGQCIGKPHNFERFDREQNSLTDKGKTAKKFDPLEEDKRLDRNYNRSIKESLQSVAVTTVGSTSLPPFTGSKYDEEDRTSMETEEVTKITSCASSEAVTWDTIACKSSSRECTTNAESKEDCRKYSSSFHPASTIEKSASRNDSIQLNFKETFQTEEPISLTIFNDSRYKLNLTEDTNTYIMNEDNFGNCKAGDNCPKTEQNSAEIAPMLEKIAIYDIYSKDSDMFNSNTSPQNESKYDLNSTEIIPDDRSDIRNDSIVFGLNDSSSMPNNSPLKINHIDGQIKKSSSDIKVESLETKDGSLKTINRKWRVREDSLEASDNTSDVFTSSLVKADYGKTNDSMAPNVATDVREENSTSNELSGGAESAGTLDTGAPNEENIIKLNEEAEAFPLEWDSCQANKVRAYGGGLMRGVVGEENVFELDTSQAEYGELGVHVVGPHQDAVTSTAIFATDETADTLQVRYTVSVAGLYTIHLTWDERNISGSPYLATVRERDWTAQSS